jgi:hypothetical protein
VPAGRRPIAVRVLAPRTVAPIAWRQQTAASVAPLTVTVGCARLPFFPVSSCRRSVLVVLVLTVG